VPVGPLEGDLAAAREAQRAVRFPAAALGALAGPARENARRLLAGARAVTTGQQAGLFTGPLLTIHKALTAVALAGALERQFGEDVVPVFWVAGDDHDFAEINHSCVLGTDGRPVRIAARERDGGAPMLPVFRERVGADGREALAELERALPPGPFRDEAVALLGAAYGEESSLAEAFALALEGLLGPRGLVVLRGWHPEVKRAARGVLLGAAREASVIDTELAREADRLRAMGRSAPVSVGEGLSLLMVEGAQGRDRLHIRPGGGFTLRRSGESLEAGGLEDLLERDPERLSGNVLLRPAVEAAVVPTVAYVGGPGELAYLAQSGPVFSRLGVARPVRMPRLGGMLVEAKVDRVLEKYGLVPEDLGRPEGEIATRIARQGLPPGAVAALAAAREALEGHFARLQSEAAAVDATLERTAVNARNQALVGVAELEKKLVAALRRANDTAIQQVSRARDQLFPLGQQQERVLSVMSFVARHGLEVLEVVGAAARIHVQRLLEAGSGGA
jgi:bacillithiol biosynthesis cysteine-adding enzyme BshC